MMFQNDPNVSDYLKGLVSTRVDISLYGLAYVEAQEFALSLNATDEYMKGYRAAIEKWKNGERK